MDRFMTCNRTLDWQAFFGGSAAGVAVLIDEQISADKGRGMLRSVPMLTQLGLLHCTHIRPRADFYQPTPYDYQLLRPDQVDRVFDECGQLVQIISQENETFGAFGFTYDLLLSALSRATSGSLLLLVVDRQSFQLKGGDPDKSLIEDWRLRQLGATILTYDQLFTKYRKQFLPNSPLPEAVSKNAWFHHLAIDLSSAGWPHCSQISDLFRFTERGYPLTPGIRRLLTWLLCDADRTDQLEQEGPEYVRKLLRPWQERGEAIAVAELIWWGCNLIDYDLDRLKRERG